LRSKRAREKLEDMDNIGANFRNNGKFMVPIIIKKEVSTIKMTDIDIKQKMSGRG
jgi:hypothetical protein